MQIIKYIKIPLDITGNSEFTLHCESECGGLLKFISRVYCKSHEDYQYVETSVNLQSGLLKFSIEPLDSVKLLESYLNAKIDDHQLSNNFLFKNSSGLDLSLFDHLSYGSLAKMENSNWAKEKNLARKRYHIISNTKERDYLDIIENRKYTHYIFFGRDSYVECLTSELLTIKFEKVLKDY